MKSWCKQKSPVYLIQRLMFRNLAKLPGDALLFCLLWLSRDKDRESHSPRNLETCTMTWPRPGALPSPKESTMTWWICQSPKKLDIVIYLQAPEPPLSFFAGPVQPCYHGISTIQRCSSKSQGKKLIKIAWESGHPWPPPAQIFILFCAVAVGRGPQSMSCRVPYLPLNHEVWGEK